MARNIGSPSVKILLALSRSLKHCLHISLICEYEYLSTKMLLNLLGNIFAFGVTNFVSWQTGKDLTIKSTLFHYKLN